MRKFEDAYRDAVKELPECHMDVERVLDEAQHARFVANSAKRRGGYKTWMRTAAVAAGVFILCGVGTATAMNYQKSIITVGGTGYSITSQKAAEAGEISAYAGVDEKEAITADAGASSSDAGDAATARENGIAVASMEDGAGITENDEQAMSDQEKEEAYQKYIQNISSGASNEEPSAETAGAAKDNADKLEVMEAEEIEPVTYASIEEFRANEDITVALPKLELLGEFEEQKIVVMDDGTYFSWMLYSEEKRFGLKQQDTRSYEQYASSTTYMGESVNERSFVNDQGLSYVVFDTMEDGEIVSTHAVISVNGRDLCLDFYGYEENVIEDVLKQLDLSIYFQD